MSRIRSKDTKPEIILRKKLHHLGYRFRLHRSDLPGKPDLVFVSRKKIIFVHGCFWHMHSCRNGRVVPKTNAEFWAIKRRGNRERDKKNKKRLVALGWSVFEIWECEIKLLPKNLNRILKFLEAK